MQALCPMDDDKVTQSLQNGSSYVQNKPRGKWEVISLLASFPSKR